MKKISHRLSSLSTRWDTNNCVAIFSNGIFNNWLIIVYSLPLGFYLQSIYSKNNLKNL